MDNQLNRRPCYGNVDDRQTFVKTTIIIHAMTLTQLKHSTPQALRFDATKHKSKLSPTLCSVKTQLPWWRRGNV